MKTKITLKKIHIRPKLRGKAAKIAALNRSAGAKARHHRRRIQHTAKQHFIISAILLVLMVGGSSVAFAVADSLIPPPSPAIDMMAYQRAAEANRPSAVSPPDQTGVGSWYALGLPSPDSLTCASTRFPRGTNLLVTDLRNGRTVRCLVNDYGPTAGTGRVIDLSRGSYRQLEDLGSGTMPVEIRVVR